MKVEVKKEVEAVDLRGGLLAALVENAGGAEDAEEDNGLRQARVGTGPTTHDVLGGPQMSAISLETFDVNEDPLCNPRPSPAQQPSAKKIAFLEALNAAHHPLALYPPQQIRTDSFSQAFFDYLQAIDGLLSMPSLLQQRSDLQAKLPRGAFSDCPICALVQGELEVKLGNLCSRALAEGVTDETAAIAACKDSHLPPKTSHVGQWVDQQLRLKALEAMASGKGQAPTRLPSISLSTDIAQLQLRGLRGPHEQRMAAAKLKCMELETAHGVHALKKEKHHGSAEGESPLIARGLVLLVDRYRTQVEQLTNDVHELGLHGPYGPERQGHARSTQRHQGKA
ncbi:hypothetical protein QJQ45_000974 [Haematococcus lacustris]|nr:hypothetical protein QJQ45_000974 [Haematococcus lacustris]